ncbi:7,8-didemethyl-8-hydroxy-5-deazariboflavin synthase CofG [Microbacterium sp. zg.Y1090]|uniref:7,8-didemethyl-8-hydroxy-5-deazariboflavin synthase CofG n=1 Tax=Microbacterium wangruii TaxID=3049073 RepID=UPI00214D92F9|nr:MULTISPECIES: 7,8-didemethyl-8-hydroxy-5-deazariboflavin synthase CofG [unclassified Microbacterium]MCR2819576.1 7,8-didemethyl-8-hydroxy-5-deazariboflavin synthase CofG [Microbacterium sp. zg.Y1090]WIM28543.1 7,8-didemethyl-8-hydroxy-5-deazariboflavin synthase CofG [Microbacterium sp. zg-Y1090]
MTLLQPPPAAATVDDALRRAAAGERVGVDDAEVLLHATGDEFERMLTIAGAQRDAGLAAAGRPGIITYSRKVFLPLTTLCRDRCHYCVFVDTPGQLATLHKPLYMTEAQVLSVARQGQAQGCKEALLTLGDRPEDRWPAARAWLDEHGYASTLDYVGRMARLITAETGLLAHLNPGVMTYDEIVALRPTAPSMGMMLETTSRRLFTEPGQVHFGSPDKDPAVRLRVIEDAGRAQVPFTTGILVGIGETLRDRAESLVAIRDADDRHGHVQEVIVQNFRAKPRTAAQSAPDAGLREYVAAVAVARLVFGPGMRVQVPPNLSDPAEFDLLVRAGADDWGGVSPVTADHVNPERPWPHLDELAARTAALGFELRERLTAHPEYLRRGEQWLDPAMHAPVAALADPQTSLAAAPAAAAAPSPDRAEPADASAAAASADGRVHNVATAAATAPSAAEFVPHGTVQRGPAHDGAGTRVPAEGGTPVSAAGSTGGARARLAEQAAADPTALGDDDWALLLTSTGADLEALVATADDLRRYTVGEAVSLVVNRNLTSTGFRAAGATAPGEFDLADVGRIAADAADLGATELCVQGRLPDSEDPGAYLDIARAVKQAAPGIHLHAYRPQDVWDLAERGGLGLDGALAALREVGVDTVPGTGVKVAAERVRMAAFPTDLEVDRWVEGISAAHRHGFRSTSVLFYGHVETAHERIAHLRLLRRLQEAAVATASGGGFSEFVPIPLPGPAGGVPLVPGRAAIDEHRAMTAVARLMLAGAIPHVQVPWPRVGVDAAAVLLHAGADDLGGTLLDGRVLPAAGIEHGSELPVADAARLAARLFRPFRLRTTDYGTPRPAARGVAAARGVPGARGVAAGAAPVSRMAGTAHDNRADATLEQPQHALRPAGTSAPAPGAAPVSQVADPAHDNRADATLEQPQEATTNADERGDDR